jgi:hypothetical protein
MLIHRYFTEFEFNIFEDFFDLNFVRLLDQHLAQEIG